MKDVKQIIMHRLSRCSHPSFMAAAALASASGAHQLCGKSPASSETALAEAPPSTSDEASHYHYTGRHFAIERDNLRNTSIDTSRAQNPLILASSPKNSHANSIQVDSNKSNEEPNIQQNTIECDYVIIGHGKAGQSAVRTIKQLDPSAKIVIVDPNNSNSNPEQYPNNDSMKRRGLLNNKAGSIHHLSTRASYIDHSNKLIHVHSIANPLATATSVIHYRKSALLATGSRGAPPPDSCIRQDAWSRILELRSTSLPQTSSSAKPMPVLDPPTVRYLATMAASQGATVAIMGSGFEALELAAYCARISKSSSSSNTPKGSNDEKKVVLLFGNSSPMSNRLPRYLSAAVTRRLRQYGMEVEERAMTRYISMDSPMHNVATAPTAQSRLELYTVKSYDTLDSKRLIADLLVLAPSVDGLNGTAVVPTTSDSQSSSAFAPRTSSIHLPWSSLISPPLLTSYLDDGRVMTNSEYHAASSLYAAGSVAKYPNARTGQAEVAGGRHVSAKVSGELAARSMVSSCGIKLPSSSPNYVQESIPVWRSDVVPYLPMSEADQSNSSLALYSMGIHALSVGKCDSEGMATHGFWWTNSNQSLSESKNGNGSKTSNNSNNPNAFMRRATRRATNSFKASSGGSSGRGSLPVYGSGIVFYLDRSGNIKGIMLWGLPFSNESKDVQSPLNNDLVERMKNMIRSNGGIAIREHSEKILKENSGANIDVGLLSYLHLVEESKSLASIALSGSLADKVSVLGKPLHRYTPVKPVELTNLGKMHRKDESGHLTEEDDLFYTTSNVSSSSGSKPQQVEEAGRRPPSLKRIYPMRGGVALVGTEEHELERELERRQRQMERSRPPKEEPLWLRQGEEQRFTSKRDIMADAFIRNIQAGRFKDGSDAVRQAPVPKAYLDAKEKFNSWTTGDDTKGGEE